MVVAVRDTGIGIAAGVQPRVFELFTRVQPDDRIKTSGLGIGLALAQKLVELHRGTHRSAQRRTGAGQRIHSSTCRSLRVGADGRRRGDRAAAARRDTQRVLVVDDNRDAAESLAHAPRDGRAAR